MWRTIISSITCGVQRQITDLFFPGKLDESFDKDEAAYKPKNDDLEDEDTATESNAQ